MASLPSYQEATQGPHWLELVAPHIAIKDYANLCRVSSRFYRQFAPRLWNDPLTAARLLGLDPDHDLQWYSRFILKHAKTLRIATRSLVRSLDFRGFAAGDGVFSVDSRERGITSSLRHLPGFFPGLRCLLLDGHPEVDPTDLGKAVVPDVSKSSNFKGPLVLSIPYSRIQLPSAFFASPYLKNLVYLDVSGITGSLKGALTQQILSPAHLPNLRIFKAQGRELDDLEVCMILKAFEDRLWSLDLSRNRLTDGVVDHLAIHTSGHTLRSNSHFDVEGRVETQPVMATHSYGPFSFIRESPWSGTFSHPQRYLADAPVYMESHAAAPQEDQFLRLDGRSKVKQDTVGSVKTLLAGKAGDLDPGVHDVPFLEICRSHGGVTHLHLNANELSSRAIEKLIRASDGQLQHLECDSLFFQTPNSSLRRRVAKSGEATLSGAVGFAHLLRPLFSPNLQVLRIHHSLVTQVLSVQLRDMVTMANIWISETSILEKVEMAFPQPFVPDMNPRLRSLTLAKIPRYSNGQIIERVVAFLKLASTQERAIEDARVSSRRGPSILPGLRHIRLEFEHDPRQELADSDSDEFEPEKLLDQTAKEFSFFGNHGWASSPVPEKRQPLHEDVPRQQSASHTGNSDRLAHFPFTETRGEYLEKQCSWNGTEHTVPVWIGPGVRGPHNAVNEYMSFLRDQSLHDNIIPASPCHVAAGVPPGTYIFSDAWDAMLRPTGLRPPTRADLRGMRDVVAAIKEYRLQTRAAHAAAQEAAGRSDVPLGEPHFHWTGTLEVSLANTMEHYHDSKHWR